jgi:hypothetical protein
MKSAGFVKCIMMVQPTSPIIPVLRKLFCKTNFIIIITSVSDADIFVTIFYYFVFLLLFCGCK